MNGSSDQCRQRQQDLALLAAHALPESERMALENHLASCPRCQAHFAELQSLTTRLAGSRQEFAGLQPSQAAQARWVNAIHAAAESSPSRQSFAGTFLRDFWREVLWPCRRAVTCTAALWLAIWIANATMFAPPAGTTMARAPLAPGTWQDYAAQRQFLAELMRSIAVPPAEPPRPVLPRPRGEALSAIRFC